MRWILAYLILVVVAVSLTAVVAAQALPMPGPTAYKAGKVGPAAGKAQ